MPIRIPNDLPARATLDAAESASSDFEAFFAGFARTGLQEAAS